MMYWLVFIIAVISGGVLVYSIYTYKEELLKASGVICLLTGIITYYDSSRFDEVSINDYESVVNNKDKCIKYSSCEEELRNILEDGKIKKYELSSYKEILDSEMKKEKEYEDWKVKLDRDMKNKEKLEQIKKELELKKGN